MVWVVLVRGPRAIDCAPRAPAVQTDPANRTVVVVQHADKDRGHLRNTAAVLGGAPNHADLGADEMVVVHRVDDGVHGDDGEREGDDYVEEDDDDQLDHHQHFEEDGVVPHFGFLLVRGDSFSFCGFLVAKKKNAHPRVFAYY